LRVVPLWCIQRAHLSLPEVATRLAEEEEEVGVETSFEELAKRAETVEEEDDDEVLIDLGRDDDGKEALVERVLPAQANEFTCRNCFLVKHRSQLADKKKMLCFDCA